MVLFPAGGGVAGAKGYVRGSCASNLSRCTAASHLQFLVAAGEGSAGLRLPFLLVGKPTFSRHELFQVLQNAAHFVNNIFIAGVGVV